MEGEPGAQMGAAAAMVFKWATLLRHQIFVHLLPSPLRIPLQSALQSDRPPPHPSPAPLDSRPIPLCLAARGRLAEADCVLALGTQLSPTDWWH